MIDGIQFKVTNRDSIESILKNPKLCFKCFYNSCSGSPNNVVQTANYKSLRFKYIQPRSVMHIRGNLYEYYSGLKNYENFRLHDAFEALQQIHDDFDLNIDQTEIIKLEWGLNLLLPENISARQFTNNIISYKGKSPSYTGYDNGGLLCSFDLGEIEIKIYDKGSQCGKESNLLRYEIKIKRKSWFNRHDIFSVYDLTTPSKIKKMNALFIKIIHHLIIYDYRITPKNISPKDLRMFLVLNSSQGWSMLMERNPQLYRKKKPA